MSEFYSGREIAESLETLGKIKSTKEALLPNDQEILHLLEESGDSLMHLYEAKLRENGAEVSLHSYLLPARQLEIVSDLVADIPKMIEWRNRVEAERLVQEQNKQVDVSKAQWATIATTSPVNNQPGIRVSFAFYKNKCAYREECGKGCRYCGLSEKNVYPVNNEQQLAALDDALQKWAKVANQVNVFEILPDGSFMHDMEVPVEVQYGMMERLSKESNLARVAVETRPEHCSASKVKEYLARLRSDQELNIYFGLETTDDFISSVVHRKGYNFKYFKDKIKVIWESLLPEEKKRLKFSVYNIMKPVYLTEQESVEFSVKMAEDISNFSQELGVPIDIKFEPSVITRGTAQDYLYHQTDRETGKRRFEPLSYFSVAELIAQLGEKKLEKMARFGQRDDIDEFSTVSMIAQLDNEKMYSLCDFMVYNAVQRFNSDKDLRKFIVDMKFAIENTEEFKEWEEKFYGVKGGSALSCLLTKSFDDNTAAKVTPDEQKRIDFQKQIWIICDEIEYNQDFCSALRKNGRSVIPEIQKKVSTLFFAKGINVQEVKSFILIDVGREETPKISSNDTNAEFLNCSDRVAFQAEIIIWNDSGLPQSIWVKIPLVYTKLVKHP